MLGRNACDATLSVCVSNQCGDHRQDGMESDVDCGGPDCNACPSGKKCKTNFDCNTSCSITHVCT